MPEESTLEMVVVDWQCAVIVTVLLLRQSIGILEQRVLEKPIFPKEYLAVVVTNEPKVSIPPNELKMPIWKKAQMVQKKKSQRRFSWSLK